MLEETKETKVPRYTYVIVVCSFITFFVADYSGYMILPISKMIIADLGITEVQFGKLFASYLLPGILLCLISGLLCDKFGTKRAIGGAIIISTIGVILRIFVTSYSLFYVCMFLNGVMLVFISVNTAKIVANWVPPEKISVYLGFAISGGPVGMAIATGTSALFPSLKVAFVTGGIGCVIVLILWFIFMKDRPKGMTSDISYLQEPKTVPLWEGLKIVIKMPNLWIIGICLGLVLASAVCANTFLSLSLQTDRGMSAVSAGVMLSTLMIGNIAGTIFGPMICAVIGKIRPFFIVFCLTMAVGIAFSWKLSPTIFIMVGLFITGFVCAAIMTQLLSLPVLYKKIGPTLAGTAGGFICTIRTVFAVFVPAYVIAPISGGNYTILFFIGGALPVVAGILTQRLPEMLPKRKKN